MPKKEKLCRIQSVGDSYKWYEYNRAAYPNPKYQCILAIKYNKAVPNNKVYPLLEKLKVRNAIIVFEAIRDIDNERGTAEDVVLMEKLGSKIGVKVEVVP